MLFFLYNLYKIYFNIYKANLYMKVLHAAETIKGGVATVINSLVEYQTQQPQINNVICLVPSDQFENLTQVHNLQSYQFNRNGRNLKGMFNLFFSLIKILKSEKPDVLHLHSSFAGLFGRIAVMASGRRSQTKVIYCPHAFGFLMETSIVKKTIYIKIEKLLSKITSKIICVSQTEYQSALKNNFNKSKLALIHNGVCIKPILNERILNNKKSYKLLFVGRFDYQKGIDVLIDALQKLILKDNNIQYELNLVGETVNSSEEYIFPNSQNLNINQLGWLKSNELENLYLTHDAILIPSRWEGFAMVPLEAMSYGLPVICSDIDAFKELDPNSNQHITLFKDSTELSEILLHLDQLPLEEKRLNAIKTFTNNFNVDDMKIKTLNCYF